MTFDTYVRRLGKASVAFSGFCALLYLVTACGGIAAALISLVQVVVLLVALGLPLLWRRIKGFSLEFDASNWAWLACGALIAVLVLTMYFDRSGGGGCFR